MFAVHYVLTLRREHDREQLDELYFLPFLSFWCGLAPTGDNIPISLYMYWRSSYVSSAAVLWKCSPILRHEANTPNPLFAARDDVILV